MKGQNKQKSQEAREQAEAPKSPKTNQENISMQHTVNTAFSVTGERKSYSINSVRKLLLCWGKKFDSDLTLYHKNKFQTE